jgi:hypothetical protein
LDKDLIIGGCSNYEWFHLRNWVKSIKASGFDGDIVLVGTNLKKETIEKLDSEGVKMMIYGTKNDQGGFDAPQNGIEPHVERFFYIWNYLASVEEEYRYVIATDTRDVIFQKNPVDWLDDKIRGLYSLVAQSEGLKYQDEPWGSNNFLQTFGPYFHYVYKDRLIYNVGVLAGHADTMRDLMMMIFQMAVNRPIRICDQAVFNFIINLEPYATEIMKCDHADGFATNLGTTKVAVMAGSGDIGALAKEDPVVFEKYMKDYKDTQPVLKENGDVVNKDGTPFAIVHQYDRIESLKNIIDERYND